MRRAVPVDIRPLLRVNSWVATFPGSVSFEEAKAKAIALAVEQDQLVRGFRKLGTDERAEIAAVGWREFKAMPDRLQRIQPFADFLAAQEVPAEDDPEGDRGENALLI